MPQWIAEVIWNSWAISHNVPDISLSRNKKETRIAQRYVEQLHLEL